MQPSTQTQVALKAPRKRLPKAVIVLVVVIGLLAAIGVAAVVVGQRMAARPEPEPTVRTAVVERTSLIAGMVLTGTLGYGDPQDLGGAGGTVTELPEAGSVIEAGQVLMEVDGRPAFLLTGELPLWREVGPGLVGPDVAALRAGLEAIGIQAGEQGATAYDDALSAGIAQLYSRGGYDPPAALAANDETYLAAAEAVKLAERALGDSQTALDEAKKQGPTKADQLAADNAVEAAERALEVARKGDSGEALTSAKESLAVAEAQLKELTAPRDVSVETAAVADAQTQVSRAEAELAHADAESRPAAEEAVEIARSAAQSAAQALAQAQKGPSELELMMANNSVAAAKRAQAAAKAGDMGEAVRVAKEGLQLAREQRKTLREPVDTSAQSTAVQRAEEDLTKARADLAAAGQNIVGPKDVLMVDSATIRIDQVKAQLGLPSEGSVLSWTHTVLHGRVDLTEAQRSRVSTGAAVTVALPGGQEIAGVVGDITNATTNPETFEMIPARARIDIEDQAALADIGLATITVSLIEDEAQDTLVVPVTALMALAEGGYCIELPDGKLVPVEVGLVADTRAEIRTDDLAEGQEVVIP